MAKSPRGAARPPKSPHAETGKTADLAGDTVEPGQVMTGNQGLAISDDQHTLRAGPRGPALLKTSICAKRSPISTTNGSPNAWCTSGASPPTVSSKSTRICPT